MSRDEELLTNMAPLPVLSGKLRSRVLAATSAARARRTRARRVLAGASAMFGILAWVSWADRLPRVSANLAAIDFETAAGNSCAYSPAGRSPVASAAYCRRDMLISAMGDDWRMVEAEFRSREEFTRRAQM